MSATNLFIVYTPYHVFLACMLALANKNQNNHLVIIADFDADDLTAALSENAIFAGILRLPGLFRQKQSFSAIKKQNIAQLDQFIQQFDQISTLFLANDKRLESQAVAYKLRRKIPDISIAILEDGGHFYNSNIHQVPKNAVQIFFNRLKLGPWYENVVILGQASFSREIYAIFPEWIRPELIHKPIKKIESAGCFDPEFQSFLAGYWRNFPEEFQKIAEISGIITVAYSGFSKHYREYAALIKDICVSACQKGSTIAVKYHPREERLDYCDIASLPNVVILPEQIPTELIYALAPANLHYIIGDISSALMTAKWILGEQIAVYSVAKALGYNDRLLDVFRQIDIQLVDRGDFDKIELV